MRDNRRYLEGRPPKDTHKSVDSAERAWYNPLLFLPDVSPAVKGVRAKTKEYVNWNNVLSTFTLYMIIGAFRQDSIDQVRTLPIIDPVIGPGVSAFIHDSEPVRDLLATGGNRLIDSITPDGKSAAPVEFTPPPVESKPEVKSEEPKGPGKSVGDHLEDAADAGLDLWEKSLQVQNDIMNTAGNAAIDAGSAAWNAGLVGDKVSEGAGASVFDALIQFLKVFGLDRLTGSHGMRRFAKLFGYGKRDQDSSDDN